MSKRKISYKGGITKWPSVARGEERYQNKEHLFDLGAHMDAIYATTITITCNGYDDSDETNQDHLNALRINKYTLLHIDTAP